MNEREPRDRPQKPGRDDTRNEKGSVEPQRRVRRDMPAGSYVTRDDGADR
jgi:hypothetical protein